MFVATNETEPDVPVRLVDGSEYVGRVEVYFNGEWGSICYKEATWDSVEADVVCQQLGFE